MNYKEKQDSYKKIINRELREILAKKKIPNPLGEAVEYTLLGGGKRLRPALILATLDLLEVNTKKGYGACLAMELIHTYSLVHDDLPAMDDDDYRRGRLTTHKVYGEAMAVLVGDALLTMAFEILADDKEITNETKVRLTSTLAKASGPIGMIGGQVADIEGENKELTLDELRYIHLNKTGRLLGACLAMGGIIAELEADKIDVLRNIGELIGLAYQVKDDLLDLEGDFESLGKEIGKDLILNKSTYPKLLGVEEAREYLKEKLEEAELLLKTNFPDKDLHYFHEIISYFYNRKK